MPIITKMDHFTILSNDLPATQAFYKPLGLNVGPRPDFSFDGLWLYTAERPVLHIVETQNMPESSGIFDHMAFSGTDINGLLKHLTSQNVSFKISKLPPPFDGWQVFFLDPNRAKVEIGFSSNDNPDAAYLKASVTDIRKA